MPSQLSTINNVYPLCAKAQYFGDIAVAGRGQERLDALGNWHFPAGTCAWSVVRPKRFKQRMRSPPRLSLAGHQTSDKVIDLRFSHVPPMSACGRGCVKTRVAPLTCQSTQKSTAQIGLKRTISMRARVEVPLQKSSIDAFTQPRLIPAIVAAAIAHPKQLPEIHGSQQVADAPLSHAPYPPRGACTAISSTTQSMNTRSCLLT